MDTRQNSQTKKGIQMLSKLSGWGVTAAIVIVALAVYDKFVKRFVG